MTTARSLGRDPLFLSSSLSKSDRAAAIKIRFADIIVKSSSNKSEAMMTIRREKRLLQERQLEEKAMIEERMKLRQEERLAVLKMEEEEKAMMEERMKIRIHLELPSNFLCICFVFIRYGPCGRSSQTPLIDHSVAVSITNGSDKDMEKDTCNFKSMTYDDPMDFGFGLPENKDKKQNSFKVCSVHSRELHFPFSLYYLAIKLIW
ncbi:hypothetical protein YC2023_073260 [Brassica napus]